MAKKVTNAPIESSDDKQKLKPNNSQARNGKRRGGNKKANPNARSNTPALKNTPADTTPTEQTTDSSGAEQSSTASSKVVPKHKFSAQTPGNIICAAGQENDIAGFSRVTNNSDRVEWRPYYSDFAQRSVNAMRINVQHYFGSTTNRGLASSAINQAVLFIKQFVDTNLGSQESYDPQDLAPYFMGVADCLSLVAEIKRDLRLIITNNAQWPYFVPLHMMDLLTICSPEQEGPGDQPHITPGAAAQYYSRHLRSTCDRLNQSIQLLNCLPIPVEMTLFGYNDDLYDAIYMDSTDPFTAQMYVFASEGFWKYSDNGDPMSPDPGSHVLFYEWPIQGGDGRRWKSIDTMIDKLNEMINAISSYSTNNNQMIQNLKNAYGTDRLRYVEPIDTQNLAPLPFVFSEPMCIAIENAAIQSQVWPAGFLASAEINQVVGGPFIVDHTESVFQQFALFNIPLQFHCKREEVTAEMIGWALRFHPSFEMREYARVVTASQPSGIEDNVITTDGCFGFAIVKSISIGGISHTGYIRIVDINDRVLGQASQEPHERITMLNVLGDFKYAPILLDATIERVHPTSGDTYDAAWLISYSGRRDVETTLRHDEMLQWWTGLTEIAWGTNVFRDFRGQRGHLAQS